MQVSAAQHFSGPIPRPIDLEHYERIHPGLADRIMKMAEIQSSHRQECEKIVVTGGIRSQMWGQIFGFIIGMSAIAAGTYLTLQNKGTEGLTTILTALASLVGVFIYGKRKQKQELEERGS